VRLAAALAWQDRAEREHQRIEVLANEPREVQEVPGRQYENGVRDGGRVADPAAQRPREPDEDQPEDRREDARGRIGRAEELVDKRVRVVQERAVVRGVVLPVAAPRQRVGLVRVNGFVVVERARAQSPEARDDGGQRDRQDQCPDATAQNRRRRGRRGCLAHFVFASPSASRETVLPPLSTTKSALFFESRATPVGEENLRPASLASHLRRTLPERFNAKTAPPAGSLM